MKIWVYLIIIIIAMASASTGTYLWYQSTFSKLNSEPAVQNGTYASVIYYGYILYPGSQMRVFDTNIQSVAQNNVTYPKTITYHYPGYFLPLNYTVGSGQMIKGFDLGILGMVQGQTKQFSVPPSEGYPMNWSLVQNISVTQNVPMYQNMTLNEFMKRTDVTPSVNSVYHDYLYGWNDRVIYLDSVQNIVTIQNDALEHQYYYPYPSVTNYKVYTNYITKNQTINVTYSASPITLLPTGAIITTVTNNMLTINANKEVAGTTLYFVVTVLKVSSGPPA